MHLAGTRRYVGDTYQWLLTQTTLDSFDGSVNFPACLHKVFCQRGEALEEGRKRHGVHLPVPPHRKLDVLSELAATGPDDYCETNEFVWQGV